MDLLTLRRSIARDQERSAGSTATEYSWGADIPGGHCHREEGVVHRYERQDGAASASHPDAARRKDLNACCHLIRQRAQEKETSPPCVPFFPAATDRLGERHLSQATPISSVAIETPPRCFDIQRHIHTNLARKHTLGEHVHHSEAITRVQHTICLIKQPGAPCI